MTKRLLLIVALFCAQLVAAQTVTPLVQPHASFVDTMGNPCVGCQLFTYVAGTTTPQATYKDASGTAVNTNPIILDISGEADIWLSSGTYKFILKDADGVEIWTVDNVRSFAGIFIPDTNGTALGSMTKRWNGFFTNIDLSGNATIAGNVSVSGLATFNAGITLPDGSPGASISKITHYNGANTDGSSGGVPAIRRLRSFTVQSADIGTSNLYLVPSQKNYRISVYISVSQAATTSSTLPKVTVGWNDGVNHAAQTLDLTATQTGNTLTTLAQGTAFVDADAAGWITVATSGYTSVGATPMQYALFVVVEEL